MKEVEVGEVRGVCCVRGVEDVMIGIGRRPVWVLYQAECELDLAEFAHDDYRIHHISFVTRMT
jgi:hypothetical protein